MTTPSQPPLDVRLVPAAGTAWAVTAAGIFWPVGFFLSGVLCCGALFAVLMRARISRAASLTLLAALLAGSGYSLAVAMRHQAVQHHPLAQREGQSVTVTVRVTEDARVLAAGHRAVLRAELLDMDESRSAGTVVVFGAAASIGRLEAGESAGFRAAVRRPSRSDLSVASLTVTGPVRTAPASPIQHVANTIRGHLRAAAGRALPAEQAALLPALALGDTSGLDGSAVGWFRDSGLTHLMAVSGANVSIVCGTVLMAGRIVGPRVAVLLAGIALVGFVIVVHPSPSVLRAALMGAVGLAAILTARRGQAVPALAATILVLLVFVPELAVDIGFALSVAATAAVVQLAPPWASRLVDRGWPRLVAEAVCICVAAQVVTSPLIAAISGRFSLSAVVANLLAGVVVAPITVLGTSAAALVPLSPAVAEILIRFCGPELWWLLRVAEYGSARGASALPVPSGLLGLVLVAAAMLAAVLLWRRRWFRLLSGCGGVLVAIVVASGALAT